MSDIQHENLKTDTNKEVIYTFRPERRATLQKDLETIEKIVELANIVNNELNALSTEIADMTRSVQTVMKPDLFITHTAEDGISVYTNYPTSIGRILVMESEDINSLPGPGEFYRTAPIEIYGDGDSWAVRLAAGEITLKSFLEEFIADNIRN